MAKKNRIGKPEFEANVAKDAESLWNLWKRGKEGEMFISLILMRYDAGEERVYVLMNALNAARAEVVK